MPRVDGAEYLVSYWQELGMVTHTGVGAVPLSASELAAWQRGVSLELEPWEFRVLLEMSRVYLHQLHESEKPECPPPYGDPVNLYDRDIVGKKVSNAFKALIQSKRT